MQDLLEQSIVICYPILKLNEQDNSLSTTDKGNRCITNIHQRLYNSLTL